MVRTQEQMKHHHHRHHRGGDEPPAEALEHGPAATDLMHDLEEILAEIDSVLEENANR